MTNSNNVSIARGTGTDPGSEETGSTGKNSLSPEPRRDCRRSGAFGEATEPGTSGEKDTMMGFSG